MIDTRIVKERDKWRIRIQLLYLKMFHFNIKVMHPFTLKDVSLIYLKVSGHLLLGHNGSGKSTIAKLMIGIEKVKSGEIFLIIKL